MGTVLTALLLFVLSGHSYTLMPAPVSVVPAPAISVPVREPLPEVLPAPAAIPDISTVPDAPDVPDLSGAPEEPLPSGVELSAEEADALSPREREQYEAMLQSLRQVRQNANQLKRERQLLEQRLRTIEQQNKALSGELDEMRDATHLP